MYVVFQGFSDSLYSLPSFQVSWSGTGNLVAITTNDLYYILWFDWEAYNNALVSSAEIGDEGVEEAVELSTEISNK
jgi:coatomer subunit beta'